MTERMRAEIKQMVDRTGKNAAYYAALDLQHFGPTPSASNFVDFDSVEEALEAVWEARGDFAGNDRARLLALGAESEALLGEDVCRYLLFPATGRLGLALVADLDRETRVELVREKPGVPLTLIVSRHQTTGERIARPPTDVAVAIIGAGGELWTVHPGLPIAPRTEPTFELAGFATGDAFTVAALIDPEAPSGASLRATFAQREVEFPVIRRVKVPAYSA